MSESLSGALRGLQASPDDLAGTADYLGAIADHWDDHVGSFISKHIDPVMTKLPDEHHVAAFDNPHGQFDESTNLKHDIQSAQDKVADRIASISTLLHELQQVTAQIGKNYRATELSNQDQQKRLLALIDTGVTGDEPPGAGGAFPGGVR